MKQIFALLISILTLTTSLSAQNVSVNKKWLEHDVVQKGVKGMKIHIDFNITGLKGKNGKVIVYFESPKGTGIKDTNGKYATEKGYVSASKKIAPKYNNTHYKLSIFMPTDEIHMKKGKHKYYCRIRFYDSSRGKFIGGSYYLEFNGTKRDESKTAKQKSQSNKSSNKTAIKNDSPFKETSVKNNPDGSTTITMEMRCPSCNGSVVCNICSGTGNGYIHIGRYMPCPACGATGQCSYCHGQGVIRSTKTWQPGEAEAYLKARREVESQSSGKRSSNTDMKICTKCGGTGVDPNQSSGGNMSSWVAHYNPSGTVCPYCRKTNEHWHTRCPRCNVPSR